MSVYRPTYIDPKTGKQKQARQWWYDFSYAGKRVRESAKTTRKTVAIEAEHRRRIELERGFNSLKDNRHERIQTVSELADAFLTDYAVRHPSDRFARYALAVVTKHLGHVMRIDVTEKTVKDYQTTRLKEKAAPKTINEEIGFLLRIVGDVGDSIRAKLRRQKALKLKVRNRIGKAYTPEQKAAMLAAAREQKKSPAIYPALSLALNAGMRDAEIRGLQWGRIDLERAFLTVGASKTEAGEGRTIPLNSTLLGVMVEYAKWYTQKFGMIQPEWYVFPFGKPYPQDPTRPMTTLKTAWKTVRKKAGVTGRWHDNRHTLITDLAESGAGDETIKDIAGHVSQRMLKHYSHIRMEAKRKALEGIVSKPTRLVVTGTLEACSEDESSNEHVKESPKVPHLN